MRQLNRRFVVQMNSCTFTGLIKYPKARLLQKGAMDVLVVRFPFV